jgi:hypothetical protein
VAPPATAAHPPRASRPGASAADHGFLATPVERAVRAA